MTIALDYHRLAEALVAGLRISPELLHVDAGLALWIGAAAVLRRPLHSVVPVLVVLAAALANEAMDRLFWGSWRASTAVDVVNGVGWPAVLCAALRLLPRLRR